MAPAVAGPVAYEIPTPLGPARAQVWRPPAPRGTVVLGHGAGGRTWSADLLLLTGLAEDGWAVALVDQPWRVAGARVAAAPPRLDLAWSAVVPVLVPVGGEDHSDRLDQDQRVVERLPRPLVCGGRSAGARVACRTAGRLGAAAVLALAFPLRPPGGQGRSRAAEARLVTEAGIPLLVLQGARDPFGTPEQVRAELGVAAQVQPVPGAHGFGRSPTEVLAAARAWLERTLPAAT